MGDMRRTIAHVEIASVIYRLSSAVTHYGGIDMVFNPFLAQQLAQRRIEEDVREAERDRLARRVEGDRRWLSAQWTWAVLGLMGIVVVIWIFA